MCFTIYAIRITITFASLAYYFRDLKNIRMSQTKKPEQNRDRSRHWPDVAHFSGHRPTFSRVSRRYDGKNVWPVVSSLPLVDILPRWGRKSRRRRACNTREWKKGLCTQRGTRVHRSSWLYVVTADPRVWSSYAGGPDLIWRQACFRPGSRTATSYASRETMV